MMHQNWCCHFIVPFCDIIACCKINFLYSFIPRINILNIIRVIFVFYLIFCVSFIKILLKIVLGDRCKSTFTAGNKKYIHKSPYILTSKKLFLTKMCFDYSIILLLIEQTKYAFYIRKPNSVNIFYIGIFNQDKTLDIKMPPISNCG